MAISMDTNPQLARLGLFDARVPRYTSYPTAPHFGTGDRRARLCPTGSRPIPADSEISLYLHVPFCRRLCWFCACRTQGTTSGRAGHRLCRDAAEGRNCASARPSAARRHASAACTGAAARPRCCRPTGSRELAEAIFDGRPAGRRWRILGRDRPERDRRCPPGCAGRSRDEPRLDRGAGFRPR